MTDGQRTRPTLLLRIAGAVGLVILMVGGIVLLGRLASSDVMAMVLTTLFFGGLLLAIGWVALRQRAWLVPLGIPFVLVALIAGVLLGRPLVTDNVVNEEIVVADDALDVASAPTPTDPPPSTAATQKAAPKPKASATDKPAAPAPASTKATPTNVKVASGSFRAIAHPGSGTATLIRTASGEVKLTFTNFSTDNGPDVRVYLSRDTKSDGRGSSFVELGALKGNKGNQQYSVPANVNLNSIDSIVLWCRAFDVGFIQAPLAQA